MARSMTEDFEVLRELGAGACGRVLAARHRASGRLVAVKVLLERLAPEPAARERFLREASLRIDSPHVVQLLDVRVEGGCVYLVLELVDGASARELLARGPFALPAALGLGEQVALGLAAAHAAGVVHRDVKPGNVLVTRDGRAKLADFGMAKVRPGGRAPLPATGAGLGTLAYVAPEQAADAKRVDARADIYGLGATLYHFVGGRPPFDAGSEAALVLAVLEDEPPPLTALRPECPREVARFVARLLEKSPDDRPAEAAAVARELAELGRTYFGA